MFEEVLAMAFTVEAVYENGVLKPAEPLPLKEHEKVRVTVEPALPPDLGADRGPRGGDPSEEVDKLPTDGAARDRPLSVWPPQAAGVNTDAAADAIRRYFLLGSPAQPGRCLPCPCHAFGQGAGQARLITTDEVLTEVLNWFSRSGPVAREASTLVHDLRSDPTWTCFPKPVPISTPPSPCTRPGPTKGTA